MLFYKRFDVADFFKSMTDDIDHNHRLVQVYVNEMVHDVNLDNISLNVFERLEELNDKEERMQFFVQKYGSHNTLNIMAHHEVEFYDLEKTPNCENIFHYLQYRSETRMNDSFEHDVDTLVIRILDTIFYQNIYEFNENIYDALDNINYETLRHPTFDDQEEYGDLFMELHSNVRSVIFHLDSRMGMLDIDFYDVNNEVLFKMYFAFLIMKLDLEMLGSLLDWIASMFHDGGMKFDDIGAMAEFVRKGLDSRNDLEDWNINYNIDSVINSKKRTTKTWARAFNANLNKLIKDKYNIEIKSNR